MRLLPAAAFLAASFASLALSTPAQVLPTTLPAVPYQNQIRCRPKAPTPLSFPPPPF